MILFIEVIFVFYVLMIFLFMIGWQKNKIELSPSIYRVSVVIAIRNEQDNIKRLIKNLKSQDYDRDLYDVIIIDDHSEDNSWDLLYNEKLDWPTYDEKLLIEKIIPFVIQINGKKRGTLEVNMNVLEEEILKKINQDKKLKKYLNEKEIKKKIFIPNKLMNIII